MIDLGINIDHVATLRQARKGESPDPVHAAVLCELSGCNSIVCHLREDRRHIQDRNLYILKETVKTRLNLEMALSEEIIDIALKVKPFQVTLVPEKREELTTEGGLDVRKNFDRIKKAAARFAGCGIRVSLFIEPDSEQINATCDTGAQFIEIHTGTYANAKTEDDIQKELSKIIESTEYARSKSLRVNAGHGLDYQNTAPICKIEGIEELNIGYSIIGRAVFCGIETAIGDMLCIIRENETK